MPSFPTMFKGMMFSVRLPNKSIPYRKSIFMYFPRILVILSKHTCTPLHLYQQLDMPEKEWGDFMDALDCLFALGKVDLPSSGGKLRYAQRNTL